jgi:serine/threonine protein kinase
MPFDPGTRLGPYEVVSFIGAGGMGEVYRARDPRLDRDVAVKVLTERVALDRRLSHFRTEAKAIAALSHPNILSIYDAELQQSPFFLVTELLEGETIRQAMKRSPLGWRQVVEIGAAIADGLGTAHAASIIHRDSSPRIFS